jgi:broad-specificity NMP kinase
MKKYYITGVPGIGKTTVMHELQQRGFKAFDVDYVPGMCRWVNRETKEPVEFAHGADDAWHKAHGWQCDENKLKATLESENSETVFVCGITDNQNEYLNLFDKVFLLHADESTFLERMAGRDAEHFGHQESDRISVLTWYKQFEGDLRDKGAVSIDASQPIAQIVDQILQEAT